MKKSCKTLIFLIILFCFCSPGRSQERKVFGKVYSAKSNSYLDYVTVKVADTSYGTTADKDGNYFIRLQPGAHKLIFSYIGYFTDTNDVFIENADIHRDVYLRPSEIMTDVIEVIGEDPAYDIIRKAIKYKKLFREKLNEYHYDAYTKYVFRSNQSPISSDSLSKEKYPIIAILESETEGYFRKPDLYKEIVKSKRETANINRGFAIPYIVNFYDESLDLGQSKITGPLADDALDYYSYKLLGTTAIDSTRVYKIQVDGSGLYPMFEGKIFIADSTFALMKVDLSVNEAAKPTAIDELSFKQKFSAYTDNSNNKFWMPTDVEIYGEGGLAGLFMFTGDVFTIISNYELNKRAPRGVFDEFAVKVLPGAKKDSAYWNEHQLVKSTGEEQRAFDKIEKKSIERKKEFRLSLSTVKIGEHFNSYPLSFYRYNRVEGSHLRFDLDYSSTNRRLRADSYFGYGFSDKKTKYELNIRAALGKDRNTRIEAGIFKRLQPLSFNVDGLFSLYNSLMGLFDKQDLYDYYYASGVELKASKYLIPQIRVSLKYNEEKQSTAYKNTDFSIRKKDQPFRENPPVNDAFQRLVGMGLTLDPNKYKFIDYGDGEVSRFTETDYPELQIGVDYSSKKLGSTYEFKKFFASISGDHYFNRFLNIDYKAEAIYFTGDVPVQTLAYFNAFNGNLRSDFAFRTMYYREYLGDRLYYASLENDFGNIFPLKSKFLGKLHLIGFINAGRSMVSSNSLQLNPQGTGFETDKTYLESGFGIGGIFDLLRVDFAWRLNNRHDGRNFNFSISLPGF